MDHLTDKQRQIIRLAFNSKDPELRRKAVDRVMTARYTQEFKNWANQQEDQFTHPETQNRVRFNSLPSQAQKEVYRRWKAGEYEDRGGPAAGGDGGAGGGGAGEGGGGSGDGGRGRGERGGRYADRKELRGEPKKEMDDATGLDEEDLGRMLPMSKLDELEGDMGQRIKRGLMDSTYNDLESLSVSVEYMAENPDDDYTKNHWLTKVAKLNTDELKKLHKGLSKKLADAKGRKYSEAVLEIANNNDLEGVDADAVWQFRKDKPLRGRKLSPEELKQKFLQGSWADAETKARVREMSADEFMAMRNSIFDEEDEELEFAQAGGSGRQASSKLRLFDRPPGAEESDKEARLSPEGRKIVRMAFHSKDPEVRRKLVRRAKAELNA